MRNVEMTSKIFLLLLASNDRPISDYGILGNDDNAIANEIRSILPVSFGYSRFVYQANTASNARVLVDDGAVNDRSLAYSHPRHISLKVGPHLLNGLVVISSHQKRRIDQHTFRNSASQANYRICYSCTGDDAAIADDGVSNLRLFNFRGR